MHAQGHFEIQPETADIEIDRAEQRDLPVKHNAFGMQQPAFKTETGQAPS